MDDKDLSSAFYSIKEFALKLGVHSNTIRRSIKNGRISAFRVGAGNKSIYRIPHSEINRMAEVDLGKIVNSMVEKRLK